jgi:hypothetical protein
MKIDNTINGGNKVAGQVLFADDGTPPILGL